MFSNGISVLNIDNRPASFSCIMQHCTDYIYLQTLDIKQFSWKYRKKIIKARYPTPLTPNPQSRWIIISIKSFWVFYSAKKQNTYVLSKLYNHDHILPTETVVKVSINLYNNCVPICCLHLPSMIDARPNRTKTWLT